MQRAFYGRALAGDVVGQVIQPPGIAFQCRLPAGLLLSVDVILCLLLNPVVAAKMLFVKRAPFCGDNQLDLSVGLSGWLISAAWRNLIALFPSPRGHFKQIFNLRVEVSGCRESCLTPVGCKEARHRIVTEMHSVCALVH